MASSRARRAALLVLGGTALVLAAQAGSETTGGRDDARAGDRQQGAMVGGQNPANSGPTAELVDAELGEVVVVPGGDWTMPEWARPRTGITEVANFHLSETPAYGSSIRPDGHLAVTPVRPGGAAGRVVATENECYQACGFETTDPDYAVVASNLKALQLRMNWMYVETTQSRFRELPEHWDWSGSRWATPHRTRRTRGPRCARRKTRTGRIRAGRGRSDRAAGCGPAGPTCATWSASSSSGTSHRGRCLSGPPPTCTSTS